MRLAEDTSIDAPVFGRRHDRKDRPVDFPHAVRYRHRDLQLGRDDGAGPPCLGLRARHQPAWNEAPE